MFQARAAAPRLSRDRVTRAISRSKVRVLAGEVPAAPLREWNTATAAIATVSLVLILWWLVNTTWLILGGAAIGVVLSGIR